MESLGCFTNLVLRRDPDGPFGFTIAAGRRRFQEAKKRYGEDAEVMCAVFPADAPPELSSAITVAENNARGSSPLTEAKELQRLYDAGYSPEAVSVRFGVAKQTQKRRRRLLRAPTEVLEGVEAGDIAVGVAERVGNFDTESYRDECVQIYQQEGTLQHKDVDRVREAKGHEEVEQTLGDDFFGVDTSDVSGDRPEEEAACNLGPIEAAIADQGPMETVRRVVTTLADRGFSVGEVMSMVRDSLRAYANISVEE